MPSNPVQPAARPCAAGGAAAHAARGGALLMVLWLSAALSAIAFSLASTVRTETGRAALAVDGLKAYYLATGAVQRALLYFEWGGGYRNPDGTPRYDTASSRLVFEFPSGEAVVDLTPESSKMNANSAPPEALYRLMISLGIDAGRARELVLAIVDWRAPQPAGMLTAYDQFYSSLTPSFRARHASLEEIEELLLVRGMTPELFYGSYDRTPDGRLAPRRGLRDCLSVYGATAQFDANTADPAVLEAIGLTPQSIASLVASRNLRPFRSYSQIAAFGEGMPGFERLTIGGSAIYTVRATARPRLQNGALSETRRTVAAMVKFLDTSKFDTAYHVLRWYDSLWVE